MNLMISLRYEMFKRVRDYATANPQFFPQGGFAAQLIVIVIAAIAELESLDTIQASSASSSRQFTASRAAARAALREELEAISLAARVMSFTIPGLANKFRLPRSQSDKALLTAARAFAKDAVPLKEEFIRREMPADFLEELNAKIAAFEAVISTNNLSGSSQISATASMDGAIERGMRAVRELNVIIRNKTRSDRAALAAWVSASHVERHSSRKSDSTKAEPVVPDSGTHGESSGGTPTTGGSNPTHLPT